jgi:hypothetical protein
VRVFLCHAIVIYRFYFILFVLISLAVYAGSAFVILEASTIILLRWGPPDWTIDFVLYLLILGAFITILVSWIYDVTPDGIEKTKPSSELKEGEKK